MRGKSNVIKRNVEKVWGARYLPKNTVFACAVLIMFFCLEAKLHLEFACLD
jgi:hypothetical protein